MCRLDTFHRFFVRFEVMAVLFDPKNFAIKNELLPELPGLLAMTQSFVCCLVPVFWFEPGS
jgi:hypothetical protein